MCTPCAGSAVDKDNWKPGQGYTATNCDAMHWFYEINMLGYKYNMNDLAASIGLVQLSRLPAMNAHRAAEIRQYIEGLAGIPGIDLLLPYEPDQYAYQIFGIRSDRRDERMIHLKSKGIATDCHYTPLSLQPLFAASGHNCPCIEGETNRFITLPLHAELTTEETAYVIDIIEQFK